LSQKATKQKFEANELIATFHDKRKRLWEIANNTIDHDPKASIEAIAELNRMDGHRATVKYQIITQHE